MLDERCKRIEDSYRFMNEVQGFLIIRSTWRVHAMPGPELLDQAVDKLGAQVVAVRIFVDALVQGESRSGVLGDCGKKAGRVEPERKTSGAPTIGTPLAQFILYRRHRSYENGARRVAADAIAEEI